MVKKSLKKIKENVAFLGSWAKNPRTTGAIAPSSPAIGRLMGRFLIRQKIFSENSTAYVVEIGAGTGSLTKGLLDAGVDPSRLILIELNSNLAQVLQKKYPHIMTIHGDAQYLKDLLPSKVVNNLAAVVSGLPFVSLPKKVSETILNEVSNLLPPAGCLLQFSYLPRKSPIDGRKFSFKAKRLGRALVNIPPATVWAYIKEENKMGSKPLL